MTTTAILDLTVRDYAEFKKVSDEKRPGEHHMVVLAAGESTSTPGNVFVILQMEEASVLQDMIEDKNMHATFDGALKDLGVTCVNGITYIV